MKPQGKVTIFMVVMIVMLSIYYFAISRGENKTNNPGDNTQDVVKCEEFENMREQVDTARQEMITTFNGILSSSTVSVDEKNAALENIAKIQETSLNEDLLETQIVNMGFNDAFVRAGETQVEVMVFSDSLSLEQVNSIVILAKTKFGQEKLIAVNNTPINGEDTLN